MVEKPTVPPLAPKLSEDSQLIKVTGPALRLKPVDAVVVPSCPSLFAVQLINLKFVALVATTVVSKPTAAFPVVSEVIPFAWQFLNVQLLQSIELTPVAWSFPEQLTLLNLQSVATKLSQVAKLIASTELLSLHPITEQFFKVIFLQAASPTSPILIPFPPILVIWISSKVIFLQPKPIVIPVVISEVLEVEPVPEIWPFLMVTLDRLFAIDIAVKATELLPSDGRIVLLFMSKVTLLAVIFSMVESVWELDLAEISLAK